MRTGTKLAAGLLFLALASKAQDCKFDIKEKDKFSGATKVGYWYQLGTDMLTLMKEGDRIYFEISSTFRGVMEQGVDKGTVGQMRLSNGEMISFTASENTKPVIKGVYATGGGSASASSVIKAKFDISNEEFAKLASSPPLAIKVMMGSKEVVKEFSGKKSEKISAAAKCMSEYKE